MRVLIFLSLALLSFSVIAGTGTEKQLQCLTKLFNKNAKTPIASDLKPGKAWACTGVWIQKHEDGTRYIELLERVWYYRFKQVTGQIFDNEFYLGENYMAFSQRSSRGRQKVQKGLMSVIGWADYSMWLNVLRAGPDGSLLSEWSVSARDAGSKKYLSAHSTAPFSMTSEKGSPRKVNKILICLPADETATISDYPCFN